MLRRDAAGGRAPATGIREVRLQRDVVAAASRRSFGIWSAEFTQAYTPGMTGMDRWIAWDKGEFVGRDAAIAERDGNGPPKRAGDAGHRRGRMPRPPVSNPIWSGRSKRSALSPRGGYGHTVGKSLAMALVNARQAQAEGTELSVPCRRASNARRTGHRAVALRSREGKAMRGMTDACEHRQTSGGGRSGRRRRAEAAVDPARGLSHNLRNPFPPACRSFPMTTGSRPSTRLL